MLPNNQHHFIVIDDSKLDCFIAEKIIKNTGKCASIKTFVQAKDALEFIATQEPLSPLPVIILVDIQMPVMNGFQFVEAFEQLPYAVISKYIIYVISSSINDEDMNKIHIYPTVKQFLNKPLTSNTLSTLLSKE